MKITGSDIHLLTVFNSVVRNRGFSAAQVELGISQPTISNHITALEERLGVRLCQRGRRGFLLTEKGQMVHEIGMALLGSLDEHSTHLAELKGNMVGRLKLAVVDATTSDKNFKLPQAIKRFTEAAPAVRIDLSISEPQEILQGILDGSYHIGIGSFDNVGNGLSLTDLYDENHALYCAGTHPLFGALAEEITEDVIARQAWVHRGYWNQQRRKTLKPSERDLFVQKIEAQLILVLSGAYVGLLPLHLATPLEREGRVRRLPNSHGDFTCTMQIVTRSGSLPNVNELFISILEGVYRPNYIGK
ncbi:MULTISPECIES: LysR family transcriptional regulator [unclassified Ruegeria]|uniref:LysR family transcriptional regulator n=1 Tax=unclassified Ruegeria TaxID=2625375 RepID=UPI001489A86F|nr:MULTISPECIES: LysR family transcriptional regulator [unclassified Ruegeria]